MKSCKKLATSKAIVATAAIVGILVIGECLARFWLGLGDPPLSIGDSEIDYIFAPNQMCHRFGNTIVYNDASMRCDFNVMERRRDVCRIFVVGDSVVNGGVLTDHKDLATTLLQEGGDASRTKFQICNVSAGSRGPGNYAAYFRKYRKLVEGQDIVVIEVNSHDLWEDDPHKTGGANVDKDIAIPGRKPFCAMWEGFYRYFLPRAKGILGNVQVNTKVDVPIWGVDVEDDSAKFNIAALSEVYALPWKARYMLIHRSRQEAQDVKVTAGELAFREYAEKNGIVIIELPLGAADYRDKIHLSVNGQKKMADAIRKAVLAK